MNALKFKILFSALILKFLLFVQLFGQTGWNNNDVLVEDGAISECGSSILSITSISMKLMDGTSIASLPLQQPSTAAAESTLVYFPSDISMNWSSFAGQGFYIEIIESDMDNGDLCTHEFRDDTWIFPNYSPPAPTPSLPNFSSTSQAYYSTCCHTNQSNQNTSSNQTFIISDVAFIYDGNITEQSRSHAQSIFNDVTGYFKISNNEIVEYNLFMFGVNFVGPGTIESEEIDGWQKLVSRTKNEIIYDSFLLDNGVLIFNEDLKLLETLTEDWFEEVHISNYIADEENWTEPYSWWIPHESRLGDQVITKSIEFRIDGYALDIYLQNDFSDSVQNFSASAPTEDEMYDNTIGLAFISENSNTSSIGTDSDGDGLYDYHETGTGIYVSKQNTGTDPNNIDSDGDGITDGIEVNQYNTNPNLVDSDSDTLSDGAELFTHNTNPNSADTNSDQINDNISLENSIDPNGDYTNVINYLSTNPESLNFFTQTQVTSAEANARTQGREDVISSPNDYSLYSQAAYDSMVAERDARPTQAAYDAIVAERDARPTQAAYDAIVAERDARPTQAAYDAMVAERDARPTQGDYDSLSQELTTLNNRVYDVLPKLTPARPIFDYPTINLYLSEAKQEIDNSREYSLTYKQIEDDITSLDGYIMVLENGINQSDLENANGLLDNIISNIESSDLSVKVSYDFTIAKAKFELAKIYLSIGDLNSTYYRVEEGKQEIENSRSFDTTYQSIDSEIAIFENALLQEDLDTAHDALEDIIYDLEYSEFASNVQYDFSIAESKFRLIYDEISSYWQVLDNYDPTPVPSETLENYIIGLNQEIEDSQTVIDQKIYIQEVKDLRPGSAMIEVSGSQATVQLQMEESSDLQTWEDTGTPATMTIPADTDTKFFRFKMAE